jgi:hypothetical protein
MCYFFITNSININCYLLNLQINKKHNNFIINFIIKLDFKTKILVLIGSFFFFLLYNFLFFFFSRKIKIYIIQKLPLINKIFHFYRKIILITYYED